MARITYRPKKLQDPDEKLAKGKHATNPQTEIVRFSYAIDLQITILKQMRQRATTTTVPVA